MPVVLGAVELLSHSTWTILLVGLSSMGFGLFLGRILFGVAVTSTGTRVCPDSEVASRVSASLLDLRSSPRTPVADTLILTSRDAPLAEPFEGWVTDRSLGGLGLSVPHPVLIGAVLRLTPEQAPEWVASHYLEVRYCRLHRGRWRLGCQYVNA